MASKSLLQRALAAGVVMIRDTREPDPPQGYDFEASGLQVSCQKLDTADYSIVGLQSLALVERKTPADLANCLFGGWERFERELQRLQAIPHKWITVDGDMAHVILASGAHRESVTGKLASIMARYNTPVVCCSSREQARDIARGLLLRVWDMTRQDKGHASDRL